MSDDTPQEDKTEEASQRRQDQFREDGKVAKSQELVAGTMLIAAGAALQAVSFSGGTLNAALMGILGRLQESEPWVERPGAFLAAMSVPVLTALGPVFAVLCVAAFVGHVSQTGPMVAWKSLEPKFSKLNPISGVKRLFFSADLYVNLLKTIGKVVFVGIVAAMTVANEGGEWIALIRHTPEELGIYLHKISVWTLSASGFAVLCLGGADYFWQRHRTNKQMMMTKEEAKREHKENEGDPMVKHRRRQMHRERMSVNKLLEAVPTADVIINNPTHISVALRYRQEDGAPVVVAKGADGVAMRIREVAKQNRVPMVTNVALARALHKAAPVGAHIPEEFFRAVAETLVFVWKQHGRRPR
ncbi:MAG: EscU/YscU/HrcU family type III secretion system export apparatus switch protein [bacterium]